MMPSNEGTMLDLMHDSAHTPVEIDETNTRPDITITLRQMVKKNSQLWNQSGIGSVVRPSYQFEWR